MIKKSVETVKRNPIILVWLLVMFSAAMFSEIINKEFIVRNTSFMDSYFEPISPILVIYRLLGIVMKPALLTGPFVYFVYEATKGKVQKGWYKKGASRGLFRYFPYFSVAWVLGQVMAVLLSSFRDLLMPGIYFELSLAIDSVLYDVVPILFMCYFYLLIIPVMAEDKARYGFKNVFRLGRKYFFAFALLLVLIYVPSFYIGEYSWRINYEYPQYAYTLWSLYHMYNTIVTGVIFVVGMNMYVSMRAQLIETNNKKIDNEEEENQL